MEQRKRILFLSSWYPSRENEALGNFVQRHAEVANKIADVTVLYATSSERATSIEFDRRTINGVDTYIVYYPKTRIRFPFLKQFISRKRYLDALKKVLTRLGERFDLVHLNEAFPAGLFALYLKKNKSLNYVLTVHWTGYLNHTRIFEKLPFYERNIHKKIFSNALEVYPVSDHLGQSLKKLNLIHDYQVIPNTVNGEIFYPEKNKRSNSVPRFLHVSSFDNKHKNVVEMLKAFKSLQDNASDFRLHLITEGQKNQVVQLIDKLGIDSSRCEVEEKATPEEVARAMKRADCLVLFSNYETFSVVIAEAWRSGIPAIYSRCGGLTEIKNSDLGVQIEKGNLNGFIDALRNFKSEQYSANEIVSHSKVFDVDNVARKFSEIYDYHS